MNATNSRQQRNVLKAMQADELKAIGADEQLPVEKRIEALTELFFRFSHDLHEASRVFNQIEDLVRNNS